MFNSKQFRELIVRPTLSKLQMYSDDAEELLMFTCATESNGGTYLEQIKGDALGVYQMQPSTYTDIFENYIMHRPRLAMLLTANFGFNSIRDVDRIMYDLVFATAMARIHYKRVKEPLPDKDDVDAIWNYYKTYYNTKLGKAKKEDSIKRYKAFVKEST